jgi:hypothetical protein
MSAAQPLPMNSTSINGMKRAASGVGVVESTGELMEQRATR